MAGYQIGNPINSWQPSTVVGAADEQAIFKLDGNVACEVCIPVSSDGRASVSGRQKREEIGTVSRTRVNPERMRPSSSRRRDLLINVPQYDGTINQDPP